MIWEADPFGVGHLVCIKDKIVVLSERGELLIFKASPDKSTLLHRQQILGFDTRAHFAFSNGCIYARDKRRLVCFDLKNGIKKSKFINRLRMFSLNRVGRSFLFVVQKVVAAFV